MINIIKVRDIDEENTFMYCILIYILNNIY